MLANAAIKPLKQQSKMYKVADRDGMYVRIMPSGAMSFRLNGQRETVYLGKYGRNGISLARARELCIDARRAVSEGRSPAIEKRRLKEAKSFGEFGEKWLGDRIVAFYADILDPCCEAWNELIARAWTIMSLARRDWAYR